MRALRSGADFAHVSTWRVGALARGVSDGSWRQVDDCTWRLTKRGKPWWQRMRGLAYGEKGTLTARAPASLMRVAIRLLWIRTTVTAHCIGKITAHGVGPGEVTTSRLRSVEALGGGQKRPPHTARKLLTRDVRHRGAQYAIVAHSREGQSSACTGPGL
jgi:hypothetical protein